MYQIFLFRKFIYVILFIPHLTLFLFLSLS